MYVTVVFSYLVGRGVTVRECDGGCAWAWWHCRGVQGGQILGLRAPTRGDPAMDMRVQICACWRCATEEMMGSARRCSSRERKPGFCALSRKDGLPWGHDLGDGGVVG